jgi:hypothetical protein
LCVWVPKGNYYLAIPNLVFNFVGGGDAPYFIRRIREFLHLKSFDWGFAFYSVYVCERYATMRSQFVLIFSNSSAKFRRNIVEFYGKPATYIII